MFPVLNRSHLLTLIFQHPSDSTRVLMSATTRRVVYRSRKTYYWRLGTKTPSSSSPISALPNTFGT